MSRGAKILSVVIAASLIAPSTVVAAGFSTAQASVVAMGAGGTAMGRLDDPGAAAYNPAALTSGWHASIGAVLAAPRLQATTSAWTEATAGASVPPFLHAAWVGETFSAGASFTIPFGSSIVWPSDGPQRFDLQEARLTVRRLSGFGGMRFGPVRIAIGPYVDFASLKIVRAIDFIEAEGRTQLDATATGVGVHAGVLFEASERLTIGLSYRSRDRLSLTGFADFDVPAELSGSAPDQAITTVITLPDRFALGAHWRIRDDFALSADVEVNLWTTVDALRIDFAEDVTTDISQPRDWESTFVPRIGATYLALDWLTARAGAFIDPSPTPAETVGPASPDSTRLGLTLGGGARLPFGVTVDVAYEYLQFLGATSPDAVRYTGRVHLLGASVSARL